MNELLRTHGRPLALLAEKMDLSMPTDSREQCAVALVWMKALQLPAGNCPFAQIQQPEAQRSIRIHQSALVRGYSATSAALRSPPALRRSRALRILVRGNVASDEDAVFGNDLEGTGGDAARVLAEGPAESHYVTSALLRWSNLACLGAGAQTQLLGALHGRLTAGDEIPASRTCKERNRWGRTHAVGAAVR